MLDNLLFSLNNVFPVFLVMLIGFFLRKIGMLNDDTVYRMDLIVFRIALPASLFTNITSTEIKEAFDPGFAVFVVLGIIVSFIVVWLFSNIFIKDGFIAASFVQGSFRGNFVLLGLPLIRAMFGNESSVSGKSSILAAFVIVLNNILSVIVLASGSKHQGETGMKSVKKICMNIITNPLIIAITFAIIFSVLRLGLPIILSRTVDYLSSLASPMALLSIGASLTLTNTKKNFIYSAAATSIKLIFIPVAIILSAMPAGFRDTDLVILLMIFGVPTAVSAFPMATIMGGDPKLTANIIVQTSLFSIFTLTLGIFILKNLNLI